MRKKIKNLTTIILTTTANELADYPSMIKSIISEILESTYSFYEIIIPILNLTNEDIEEIKRIYPFYTFCLEIKFIDNENLLKNGNNIILEMISGENFLTIDLNKSAEGIENLKIEKFWLNKLIDEKSFGNFRLNNDKYLVNSSKKVRGLVSIIIPVFNNLHFTKVAISSILEVSDTDFEIIIINNNSTDGTFEYLVDLQNNFLRYDKTGYCKNFKVIGNNENKRFSIACNQGAEISSGEYFLFLNNDTKVTKNYLSRFVDTFDEDHSIGIVGAKLIYEDRTIQHCGVSFDNKKNPFHIFRGYDYSFPSGNVRREYNTVTAAALLIKRSVFNEIDKFDEGYINCFEDIDLCLKARENGYKIIYNPEVLIFHYESKTPGRKNNENISGKLLYSKWFNKIKADDECLYSTANMKSIYSVEEKSSIIDYDNGGVKKLFSVAIEKFDNAKYYESIMDLLKLYMLDPANMAEVVMSKLIDSFKKLNISEKAKFYQNHKEDNDSLSNETVIKKQELKNKYVKGLSSIIIPVLNNLHYTKGAITSVLANTVYENYEIIVVNNNSNDGTYEYLEELKNSNYSLNYPNCKDIKIIHNKVAENFSKSNNIGARLAVGENLILLNNDTLVESGWLRELWNTKKNNNKCAIVGSKLIYDDRTIQHAGVVFSKETPVPFHFMQFSHFDHLAVNIEREFSSVTAACMLIDHEIYDNVNGLDESFINCFEDIDLCFKVKELGYKIFYSPKSVVTHFESKTPGRKDHFSLGLNILTNRWSEKISSISDANKLLNEFGLNLNVDNMNRQLNIDFFGDKKIVDIIKEAVEIDYNKNKDYNKVIEKLYPIYLLKPNNCFKEVYKYLGLSYKYLCNEEKADFFLSF